MLWRPQKGPGDSIWGRRLSPSEAPTRKRVLEPVAWLKEGVMCLHLCLHDRPEEGMVECMECGEKFLIDPDNPNPEVCGLW